MRSLSKPVLIVSAMMILSACVPEKNGWQLAWADEFAQDGLPNPAIWDYEDGFVRNQEAQFYTRKNPANARVENGVLVIEAHKQRFQNPSYEAGSGHWKTQRKTASYTSASLITLGKKEFRYGRVEVRAKVPPGKGMWPAIWMMGVNRKDIGWPRCGEIDIMEYLGRDPDAIYGTAHYSKNGTHDQRLQRYATPAPAAGFHVYAIEWSQDAIDFYYDGIHYHRFRVNEAKDGEYNPFQEPHYLLINLAIGGNWGGTIDDRALPAHYLIDYVRVYKRSGD